MTIQDFIEILEKYPKNYKIYDDSDECARIAIRDTEGRYVDSLYLYRLLLDNPDDFDC